MTILLIIISVFLLAIALLLWRYYLLFYKQLDEFIEGKFFQAIDSPFGPFKKIAQKINIIVHNLSMEKETIEDLLQDQHIVRYQFTEYFLEAHSAYKKEDVFNLALDTLYKMFHAEVICLVEMKPDLFVDVHVRQSKDHSSQKRFVKPGIPISDKKSFFDIYLSNVPADKECQVFVPEVVGDLQNVLQVPIRVDKQLIGVVQMFNKSGGFANTDKDLVQTIALSLANQIKVIDILDEEQGALEKYGAIINTLTDGIIIFDEDKNIIMENPSARDFFSLNQVKKTILIDDLLSNKKFSTINLVLFKPERLVLNGKIDELPDLSNGSKTYILILRNVTEVKRKEREKSELFFLTATSMHNELRTIIRKINNNKEAVSENAFKTINFCYLLLNKLIYHAEMDSGPLRLFKKPVKVSQLLNNFIEEITPMLKENNVSITSNTDISEQRIFIDSEKIKLSFKLLIEFLLTKLDKCTSISVESSFDEERFVVRFLQVAHFYNTMELFELTKTNLQIERFMQSDQEVEELNLELAYIKHVLVSHGGDFVISNEHDGTRFSFIIPL